MIHVPYVPGRLVPATKLAIEQSGFPYLFHELPIGDDGAYARLVRNLWNLKRSMIICEQDVVPTIEHLHQMVACSHDWCSYCYDDGSHPEGPMFGLVHFTGAVMQAHPWAADDALVVGKRRDTDHHWGSVDSAMARNLMIRGVKWYRHIPNVHHSHLYKGLAQHA